MFFKGESKYRRAKKEFIKLLYWELIYTNKANNCSHVIFESCPICSNYGNTCKNEVVEAVKYKLSCLSCINQFLFARHLSFVTDIFRVEYRSPKHHAKLKQEKENKVEQIIKEITKE